MENKYEINTKLFLKKRNNTDSISKIFHKTRKNSNRYEVEYLHKFGARDRIATRVLKTTFYQVNCSSCFISRKVIFSPVYADCYYNKPLFLKTRGGTSAILARAKISRNYPYCYYKLINFSSATPQIFGTDLYRNINIL